MLYNKKTHQVFILLSIIIFLGAIIYHKITIFTPVKNIKEISKQEQQEYQLAVDIIQSFSGKFQQEKYPSIENYLSIALQTYPGFQKKYGSSVKILGRIPFYGDNKKIRAYEYILESSGIISGSIYEALVPVNVSQVDRNLFFVPNFSLGITLTKGIGKVSNNIYQHDLCVHNMDYIYCLPPEKPFMKTMHEYITVPNSHKYSSLEWNMREYFGTGGFYSFGERGYVYFDARTHRVFNPMPGSIMTYEMLD